MIFFLWALETAGLLQPAVLSFFYFSCPWRAGAPDKTQGPATCLSYLGIEVDMGAGCCCLPAEKVSKLLDQIEDCMAVVADSGF